MFTVQCSKSCICSEKTYEDLKRLLMAHLLASYKAKAKVIA